MALTDEGLSRALHSVFITPNEVDSNLENAGIADGLYFIGRAIHRLAQAVENVAVAARDNNCSS